jgi:F-type H+-transporting ATPase subunit a
MKRMEGGISIHLAPLALFYIGTFPVTNTLVTTLTVSLLLVAFAFFAGKSLKLKPTKFSAVVEILVMFPYQFVKDTLGDEKMAKRIFPLIMTIFLLVLFQNWFGLLPITEGIGLTPANGGEITSFFYSGSTDINFTLALAVIAFITIEFFGITTLGFLKYAGKFITFKSPMKFAVGLLELISELARLITFSFRLFGNVFAGKVLILVIIYFVPYFLPIPFLAFETFVGFIQAAIFALLTLFFTKIAIELHEDGEHESSAQDFLLAAEEALEGEVRHSAA